MYSPNARGPQLGKAATQTLEDRNAMLERDVQRFNERKELERQVGHVTILLTWLTQSL
jgi:hypothetical protein